MSLAVCDTYCSSSYLAIMACDCTFDSCKFPKPLGWFSLWITTTSLTSTGTTSVPLLWQWASLNSNRYSFCQCSQKRFKMRFRCLDLQFSWLPVTSSSLSSSGTGSGKLMTRRPIRGWDGVSGSSRLFEETYVSGRELSTISSSVRAVRSSSYESLACPMIFLRHHFVDRTNLSKIPPYHGALGMLNTHFTPSPEKYLFTSLWPNTAWIVLEAALNVFPLSEITRLGSPRLAANRLKLRRKVEADISGTRSKCTALTTQHVYKHIQTLLWVPFGLRMYSGPAKSTPVVVNGGASWTR